ncbi:MAG: PepSY-like domain-containing protein [Saprospiraceae bacterium]|nr:PepSY-like domain-containing protein [Saprospiraceae bacterium]
MRIVFLLAFLMASCNLAEPPAAAVEAFKAKYPQAEKISWNIDRNGRHEAEYTLGDTHYRSDFEADGTWVETEHSVKWKDLPPAVQQAFEEEDKKKNIIELEAVDSQKEGIFYDIEYKIGDGKQDIRIAADGRVLGTDTH